MGNYTSKKRNLQNNTFVDSLCGIPGCQQEYKVPFVLPIYGNVCEAHFIAYDGQRCLKCNVPMITTCKRCASALYLSPEVLINMRNFYDNCMEPDKLKCLFEIFEINDVLMKQEFRKYLDV